MQGRNLYVGNLDYSITQDKLKELFSTKGEVKHIKMFVDRGFAFVEMFTQADAKRACDSLNGTEYMGRKIKVNEARNNRDRRNRSW
jgi:RNA recognition motif-containing protein